MPSLGLGGLSFLSREPQDLPRCCLWHRLAKRPGAVNLRQEDADNPTVPYPLHHVPVIPGTSILRQVFNWNSHGKKKKPSPAAWCLLICYEAWIFRMWSQLRSSTKKHVRKSGSEVCIPDLCSHFNKLPVICTYLQAVLWLSNKPDWQLERLFI